MPFGPNILVGVKRGNRVTNVQTFKPGQNVYIYRTIDPPIFLGCRTIAKVLKEKKTLTFTDPLPEGVDGGDYILAEPILGDDANGRH